MRIRNHSDAEVPIWMRISWIDMDPKEIADHKSLEGVDLSNVYGPYIPISAIHMRNGCCSGKPVILTVNVKPDGRLNFSCQCQCGGWCTSGQDTGEKAVHQYRRMSRGENVFGVMV